MPAWAACLPASTLLQQQNELPPIPLTGSWGTKISTVVSEVLRVCLSDHSAKVLVFSTWAQVLLVVSRALQANSVAFLQLQSNRKKRTAALMGFKTDPSIRSGMLMCFWLE